MRCPNCKCQQFVIHDYWTYPIEYIVEKGVVTPFGRGEDGEYSHTICDCEWCGHTWRPRKAKFEVDS